MTQHPYGTRNVVPVPAPTRSKVSSLIAAIKRNFPELASNAKP